VPGSAADSATAILTADRRERHERVGGCAGVVKTVIEGIEQQRLGRVVEVVK
jgi:hypothetical protein